MTEKHVIVVNELVVLMYDVEETLRYAFHWPFHPGSVDLVEGLKAFIEVFEQAPSQLARVDLALLPDDWMTMASLKTISPNLEFKLFRPI